MVTLRPHFYPHWGNYAYTRRGFLRSQVPRLRREGFTEREISRLSELYFRSFPQHQNDKGDYVNNRHYRLYAFTRQLLKGDRKRRLFDLVERSGLFVIYRDSMGEVAGFRSPRAACRLIFNI